MPASRLLMMPVLAVVGSITPMSRAAVVPAGTDCFCTVTETFFVFPTLGRVDFIGVPIDPAQSCADTMITRLEDAIFPFIGGSAYPGPITPGTDTTIGLRVDGLSLRSAAPVPVSARGERGSFFDVFVALDPATPSTGTMTIRHEWDDTGAFQGTFDSALDINAVASFVPVGGGPVAFQIPLPHIQLSAIGTLWLHGPIFAPTIIEDLIQDGQLVARHTVVAVDWPSPGPAALAGITLGLAAIRRRRA